MKLMSSMFSADTMILGIDWAADIVVPHDSSFSPLTSWSKLVDESNATCLDVFSNGQHISHYRLQFDTTAVRDQVLTLIGLNLGCNDPVLDVYTEPSCLPSSDVWYVECSITPATEPESCQFLCTCPGGCQHIYIRFSKLPFIKKDYHVMKLCSVIIGHP